MMVVLALLAVAWVGWRPLFRLAETNFWSLNALAVQPGYALWREALRHLTERSLKGRSGAELARMRAMSCAAAGLLLFAVAALVALAVWPATRWIGTVADFASPHLLILPTIANSIVVMSAYLGVAALVWGFADATADQPLDLEAFDAAGPAGRVWRVAHLSDVHVVGERYGFRIESGRAGPRGNGRLVGAMERLAALHAARAARPRAHQRRHDGRREFPPNGPNFSTSSRLIRTSPAHAHSARQPRRQHRRSDQSGAARPAVQPGQDAAQDARALGDRRGPGRSRARRQLRGRNARTRARRRARTATGRARSVRGHRRLAALRSPRPALGRSFSADPAARRGGRARGRAPRLQRRHEFLVHQCARHDLAPGRRCA